MSKVFLGLFSFIPYSLASSIARRFLSIAGFGVGTSVASSGEIVALKTALAIANINVNGTLLLFDVGGHVGEWSAAMLTLCPNAQIHAFEPSEQHRSLFSRHHKDNTNVRLVASALGASTHQATLYRDKNVSGLASLTKRQLDHMDIHMTIEETVSVTSIDGYCAENEVGHIDVLKIDVEGHELDVLKGAIGKFASKDISIVQFEFGGSNIDTRTYFRDFFHLFDEAGFDLYLIRAGGRLAKIARYREFLEQFTTTNYLAIKRPDPS